MKKLAVIRGKNISNCPYGLPVIAACKFIGDTILTMQALSLVEDDDREKAAKNNKIIYLTDIYSAKKAAARCPFANDIMTQFDKVECSWGDTAAGEGVSYLTPSPLYPRTFIGDGVSPAGSNKGQDVSDPRLYFDAPERGIDVPFGMFSIFSDKDNEKRLLKIAEKYTNKIVNIGDKLAYLRDKYFDALKLLVSSPVIIKLNDQQLEKLLFVIDDWTK